VARFHGRPLDAEFLTIDGTVQCIEVERVVREDRQRGDGVADAVVGRVQRCVAQVLLDRITNPERIKVLAPGEVYILKHK
jgi:hypothetical protein